MKRLLAVPVVLAAGMAAATPAGAADSAAAHASGGEPIPLLPSLVQTHLKRVGKALDRLAEDVNDLDVHAAKSSKTARRQLWAAWRGARYYVAHPPAPDPEAEDAHAHAARRGVRLRDLAPRHHPALAARFSPRP